MSKIKKGSILIEIPIVLGIIGVASLICYQTLVKGYEGYNLRVKTREVSVIFKAALGELSYNSDYKNIKLKFQEKDTLYINKESMNLNILKGNPVEELLQEDLVDDDFYIAMIGNEEENAMNIELTLKCTELGELKLVENIVLMENLK